MYVKYSVKKQSIEKIKSLGLAYLISHILKLRKLILAVKKQSKENVVLRKIIIEGT